MERTLWITALALAVTASVSCKDSNPNYIAFDAQAPTQTTDAKSDLPPPIDGAASDVAADRGSSSPDAPAIDAPVDTALARDAPSDGASSDAPGPDVAGDATANDGGDGP
jgi:hypothetical protein